MTMPASRPPEIYVCMHLADDTPTELLERARERHRAGDLPAAAEFYNRVLAISPDHPHALHYLGLVAQQTGDSARAAELIGRAIALSPENPAAHSNLGAALVSLNRLGEAEASFRRAAELNPNLAESHSNLAAVLADLGEIDGAIEAYGRAHRAAPGVPRFMKRLADLYLRDEQYDFAIDWFGRYLALVQDDAEAFNNLAHALESRGRLEEAEGHYRRAVALCPTSPEISSNLAALLTRIGRRDEADEYFRRAFELTPEKWASLSNLAGSYVNRREVDRAIPIYERLLPDHPDDAQLHNDYGVALSLVARLSEAEATFEKAIALKPDYVEAWNNLAGTRLQLGRRKDAIRDYKKAISLRPRSLQPHLNLCLALAYELRVDEAYLYAQAAVHLESYRPRHFSNPHKIFRSVCDFDAIEALGDLWATTEDLKIADFSSNFLEMLVLTESESEIERLAELHRRWYRDLVCRMRREPLPPIDPGSRTGKLRIGIMSSDLRRHSVAKFVLPILEHYDRDRFEIYCYSPTEDSGDDVQRRVRELVKEFRVVRDRTDREFAEIIRADAIDILFELNGFTRDTRLPVLTYKPAPVQIYWLGYPFTTGIEEVDYLLLDPWFKPTKDSWLTEKPLLMKESWICMGSFSHQPISAQLPVERNGVITFGSLNNPYKLNRKLIALWSRVMNAVPGSRFLYVRPECSSFTMVANLTREFERNGITRDRLYFVNNRATNLPHLLYYDEIDITLDTWPLTGGTTTCDTLWMGTPVVTRYGPNMHQRLSYSMLKNVGLDELCVTNDDDYVRVASELAKDIDSLRLLRHELRRSVQESALGRVEDYVRNFCDLMAEVAARHGLR